MQEKAHKQDSLFMDFGPIRPYESIYKILRRPWITHCVWLRATRVWCCWLLPCLQESVKHASGRATLFSSACVWLSGALLQRSNSSDSGAPGAVVSVECLFGVYLGPKVKVGSKRACTTNFRSPSRFDVYKQNFKVSILSGGSSIRTRVMRGNVHPLRTCCLRRKRCIAILAPDKSRRLSQLTLPLSIRS